MDEKKNGGSRVFLYTYASVQLSRKAWTTKKGDTNTHFGTHFKTDLRAPGPRGSKSFVSIFVSRMTLLYDVVEQRMGSRMLLI